MKRHTIFLVLIMLLASILRLWQLGNIPNGITNDESGYMYSAYSIWKTGHDVSGRLFPLSFNLDNSFSPVYIYATAPFVGILGLNPFIGRLPYALISILVVFLIYLFPKKLFDGNKYELFKVI
jgi:4-amino-4-deoxy-L-arabinose transferase-like glycosyltransferase